MKPDRQRWRPLRVLRKQAGLTQVQVAEKVDVAQGTVSNWENGRAAPVSKTMRKLVALYGCTVEELREAIKNTQP